MMWMMMMLRRRWIDSNRVTSVHINVACGHDSNSSWCVGGSGSWMQWLMLLLPKVGGMRMGCSHRSSRYAVSSVGTMDYLLCMHE